MQQPLAKPPLIKGIVWQLVLLALIAIVLHYYRPDAALSFLMGGLTVLLPQAWFTAIAFRHRGARQAQQVTQNLYRGEAGKFVLTAVMFASVFLLVRPLNVAAVFIGYVLMWAVNTVVVARLITRA